MIEIVKATTLSDFNVIEKLADVIWREHYIPITGVGQVEYMLKKYQSATSISEQITQGFEYFLVHYGKLPVGYVAIENQGDTLFLSKIYVKSDYRGKKIGKTSMQFVETKAKDYGLPKIMLTVNKFNTNSIKAYEKLGFINMGPIVKDIGGGYIMDDFQMEKTI